VVGCTTTRNWPSAQKEEKKEKKKGKKRKQACFRKLLAWGTDKDNVHAVNKTHLNTEIG
jgi:hypothetical protein